MNEVKTRQEKVNADLSQDDWITDAMPDMKTKINEFLFQTLPGGTTLSEMEELALEVFERLHQKWRREYDRLYPA